MERGLHGARGWLTMCGVSGFLSLSKRGEGTVDELRAVATRMADALHHRGPDDSDVWVDPEAGIALGHRRLSIIDLSPQGRQPMCSANGRYVICFNGEIYNHKALRQELEQEFERTGRPCISGSLGHRGHARSHQPVGPGTRSQAIRRHVRLRLVGSDREGAVSGPRSIGASSLCSTAYAARRSSSVPS